MMVRRILGIDPGSRLTGFGIIEEREKGKPHCLVGGVIRLNDKEMAARLGTLFQEVQQLVNEFRPTELAIEQVFVHKNVRSALMLGQARGVVLASVMIHKLQVFEYAPRKIKEAVVGHGNADKLQVQHMCKILLNLSDKPQADAADALAVALCHFNHASWGTHLKETTWKTYDRSTTR